MPFPLSGWVVVVGVIAMILLSIKELSGNVSQYWSAEKLITREGCAVPFRCCVYAVDVLILSFYSLLDSANTVRWGISVDQ